MKNYRLSVVIEKDVDGYFAFCPELQGCYTQDDSYKETLENIKDTIRLHLEDRIEGGEGIPMENPISLTSLEVAVGGKSFLECLLRKYSGKILHPKVLRSILRDAGLTLEQFKKLMR